MAQRYRLYRRKNKMYYIQDEVTGKQFSTHTRDLDVARQLIAAHNEAALQPALNVLMAGAYLQGNSSELIKRTWNDVLKDAELTYHGETKERWQRFAKSKPLDLIRGIPLAYTQASHLLAVLRHPRAGTSTNVWLRRLHNYAIDYKWLLSPVMSNKAWPPVRYQPKSGISEEEHARIIGAENNQERKLYYEMLWETGGAQTDIACLRNEQIDWEQNILCFNRRKLKGRGFDPAQLMIGPRLRGLLAQLPKQGLLFPKIATEQAKHRASEFKRRCRLLGIEDKTLHCYRYAWAERAFEAGMPEREAMAHLGHKSAAVHHAYAKKAKVVTMPLEFYEEQKKNKILKFKADGSPEPPKQEDAA